MKPTLLLVEDDRHLREVLSMELEFSADCRIICAEGLRQAMQILERTPVDLILSDVMMPDGNGYQLARMGQRTNGQKPFVILMTGLLSEDLANLKKEGIDAVVSKPFDGERMVGLIQDILRGQARASARELELDSQLA